MLSVGEQKSLSKNKGAAGKNRLSACTDTVTNISFVESLHKDDVLLTANCELPEHLHNLFALPVLRFCNVTAV